MCTCYLGFPMQEYSLESLSIRGRKAADTIMRPDVELWFEAAKNSYHPVDNPAGALALNVAENVLCWPLMQQKLNNLLATNAAPDWTAKYTSPLGHMSLREALADLLGTFMCHRSLDPNHIAISAGATAVIEMTSFLLADHGTVAGIPAPAYPVYQNDIGNFPGVERHNIITHSRVAEMRHGPVLHVSHLIEAQEDCRRHGKELKMLILTTPDNPTGAMFSAEQLREYAAWCISEKVHLVVNEIYGLSLIDTSHQSIASEYQATDLTSFLDLIEEHKSDYLHYWYALSKDFGVSGMRVGMLYSRNKAILKAYENFNLAHMASNHTQWMVKEILSDHAFVKEYISTNQQRLTESYMQVISLLRKFAIPYVPARGSLFVWADFSPFLSKADRASENELWLDIYRKAGVLLTPGAGFGHEGYGCFRIVHTAVPPAYLEIALQRLENYFSAFEGNFKK